MLDKLHKCFLAPFLPLLRNRGERRMNAFECMRRVYQTDGLRGFYRGMSASYAGISETVIHFVIYEHIKRRILEARAPQNVEDDEAASRDPLDFIGMMMAAATSKSCATTIAYPHGESKRQKKNLSFAALASFSRTVSTFESRFVGMSPARLLCANK